MDRFPVGLSIGGAWRAAEDGRTFAVHDPATGETPRGRAARDESETRLAIDAAAAAFEPGGRASSTRRADVLWRIHERPPRGRERLAELRTAEQGGPLARGAARSTSPPSFFRWYAEEARRVYGR